MSVPNEKLKQTLKDNQPWSRPRQPQPVPSQQGMSTGSNILDNLLNRSPQQPPPPHHPPHSAMGQQRLPQHQTPPPQQQQSQTSPLPVQQNLQPPTSTTSSNDDIMDFDKFLLDQVLDQVIDIVPETHFKGNVLIIIHSTS